MPRNKQIVTEYRPYELPLDYPVLLLSGDRWHISDVKSGRLHFHNCLEIGICLSDSGTMEFENRAYEFHMGDITCIPKNLPHTTYSTKGTQSLWTYIFLDTDELFRRMTHDSSLLSELSMLDLPCFQYIMPRSVYPKVYSLASAAADELQSTPPYYQYSSASLLFSLCIEIRRVQLCFQPSLSAASSSKTPDSTFALAPALDYIDKNYMYEFTIEDLANLCHLSETHFRRVFQSTMGTSPLDFINNIRIQKACALLKTTQESILYISEQVGFRSISSFNRCFSKAMGESPRNWRKQILFSEGKAERGAIVEYQGWL